ALWVRPGREIEHACQHGHVDAVGRIIEDRAEVGGVVDEMQWHVDVRGVVCYQRTEIAVVPDANLTSHGNGLPLAALQHWARDDRGRIAIGKIGLQGYVTLDESVAHACLLPEDVRCESAPLREIASRSVAV